MSVGMFSTAANPPWETLGPDATVLIHDTGRYRNVFLYSLCGSHKSLKKGCLIKSVLYPTCNVKSGEMLVFGHGPAIFAQDKSPKLAALARRKWAISRKLPLLSIACIRQMRNKTALNTLHSRLARKNRHFIHCTRNLRAAGLSPIMPFLPSTTTNLHWGSVKSTTGSRLECTEYRGKSIYHYEQ